MNTYYYNNNNNFPIYISNETKKLTPSTFLDNGTLWENNSIDYFFSKINQNIEYNIIDIGAQSGLYSLFAKYLPKSTFYSFEPYIPTFQLLNDNLKLNNISNVKTFNIGLSNHFGKTTLNTCLSHNGLHTLGNNPLRFNDIKPMEILVDTLDNLFYNKNIPVHFIKIDTEGWEYNIFKGSINTIKKYKPFIQLEWNETNMKQCDINPNEFKNFIENEINYTIDRIIDEELFIKPKYFN